MKRLSRIINVALAVTALYACSDIMENVEDVSRVESHLVFTATNEGISPDTKTVRLDDGSTWWNPSEKISVFYGSGSNGGSKFTSTNSTSQEIVGFDGSIQMSGSGKEFWAIYPYSQENECDGNSITTVIPSVQIASEGNFSSDSFPTIAQSKTLDLAFWNICGGIKFSVARNDIQSVSFKGNNGETLAGKVKVAFDASGVPEVTEVVGGNSEVTLTAPDGGTFKAGKYYYLTLLPTALNSGFTMTFVTANETGSIVTNKSQSVKRSVFGILGEIDSKVEEWAELYHARKIGDIVDANGVGVVVYVEDERVLLMSVGEIYQKNWNDSYEWCLSYGYGWRMPTIDELSIIHSNFTAINQALSSNGYTTLTTGNYCHWSSTQNPKNSNYYNRERLHDGLVCNGTGSDENKNSTKNYTRAVKELKTDGSITPVESVSLSHSSAEIKVGETLLLTATVMPTYANYNIVWSSSDNSIASVNNGLVTGVSLGNATITASAGGKNATCNVSIVEESSNSVETVSADATQSYNYLGGSNVYSATLKGKASISGDWDLDTYFYYSESYNTLSALRMSGTRVNGSSNAQSFEATLENLDENTTYYYVACVNLKKNGTTYDKLFGEVKSFTTPEYYLPPYVDLGLPSGVKWGVMNLGATNPTESGLSVSWGVGNGNGNSNYQTGKILPLEEDIAHRSLGGYWRTPTREEWVELFTYCKCSYTVGSSGMTVSRNGRKILIPLNDYWSSTCATAYSRSSTGGYSVATAYALWGNSEHFKTYIEKKILNTNTAITSSGKIRPVYVDR